MALYAGRLKELKSTRFIEAISIGTMTTVPKKS